MSCVLSPSLESFRINELLSMLTQMEAEDMSELKHQLQQMTNEELIDFALEHLGQEHEHIRKAALQEHFLRVKDAPNTVIAPAGDDQVLGLHLARLRDSI